MSSPHNLRMTIIPPAYRLSLALGLAALFAPQLSYAQRVVQPETAVLSSQLQESFVSANYLAYRHDLPRLKSIPLADDQLRYRAMMAEVMTGTDRAEDVVTRFLERYPQSLDRSRAELLLGLIYVDEGLLPLAKDQLESVETTALTPGESQQYALALAYTLLSDTRQAPDLSRCRQLLDRAARDRGLIGGWSQLYLGAVAWQSGDINGAERYFSAGSLPSELQPEAAYQRTLLSFVRSTPTEALESARQFSTRYPQLADRATLRAAAGQAYYALGSYAQAISMLQPLQELSDHRPTPEEQYALGTALYAEGRYQESLAPLSAVAEQPTALGAGALFLVGNVRLKLQRPAEAALAYSSAGRHPGATAQVREASLYNGILLQDETQRSNFGQTTRMAAQFVREFPQSKHRAQILGLLKTLFLTNKDYAESLATLESLDIKSPELTEAKQYVLIRLGESALSSEQFPEAQRYLSYAIDVAGRMSYTAEAYLLRSSAQFAVANYREAEKDATQALEINPRLSLAYYLQGYARYNTKQYLGAQRSFTTYLRSVQRGEELRRADAYMRLGDTYLWDKKTKDAFEAYRRANDLQPSGSDEALRAMADIYGRWGQYDKQLSTLDELIQHFPSSSYRAEALYNKGRALILSGSKDGRASAAFAELEKEYPDTQFARLGMMEQAMLAYNSGATDRAIATYKQLISRYPESEEARSALSDLRSVYLAQDRIEEYTAYASSLGHQFAPSDKERVQLEYLALASRYRRDPDGTLSDLEAFVRSYPESREAQRAELMLATRYAQTGRTESALALYKRLSVPSRSLELRIPALEGLTRLYESRGERREELASWEALYAIEGLEAPQKLRYGQALIETAYAVKDYKRALSVGEVLLKRNDLSAAVRGEITLLQGKSEEATGATVRAQRLYEQILRDTDTSYGAEAYVRHADLLYQAGRVTEARDRLEELISRGTSQQYQLARAFLLLADCHYKLGEAYVAKQYVESLRDNYQGGEADIARMITERLNSYKTKR